MRDSEPFPLPYSGAPYDTPPANQPSRRTKDELARRADRSQRRGAFESLEVQADAFVSRTRVTAGASVGTLGMSLLSTLSKYEEQLNEVAPMGAHRYRALADAVTVLAIEEILDLRQGG